MKKTKGVAKGLFLRIGILILSTLFFLFVVECSIRIFYFNTEDFNWERSWDHISDPRKPDSLVFFNYYYEYDSDLGFKRRNNNIRMDSYSKLNKDFKILALGDSITEQTRFIEYLNIAIKRQFPNLSFSIFNGGTAGYDTLMELKFFKKYGLKLSPDFVIIQTHLNDFSGSPVVINKGDYWTAINGGKVVDWINPFLFHNSLFYKLGVVLLVDYLGKYASYSYSEGDYSFKNNVKKPLKELVSILENNNIGYSVVNFPMFHDEKDQYSITASQYLREINQELKLGNRAVDLRSLYKKYSLDVVKRDDAHPNHRGSRVGANKVARRIKKLLRE